MKDLSELDAILARAPLQPIPPGTKFCNGCSQFKSLDEFYTRRDRGSADRFGKVSKCKSCSISAYRSWYRNIPPEQKAEVKRKGRKARYLSYHRGRITEEEASRLAADKKGTCEICLRCTDVFVDHCHSSGERRGFICSRCNLMLGQVHDDIQLLCRAAEYLYKYTFRK